jgi:hypothetical protein
VRIGSAVAGASVDGSGVGAPLVRRLIEDVVSAPDICSSNVLTNDNLGAITIGLHIHDRTAFEVGDSYSIFFDTDANTETGSVAAPGVPAGADYEVKFADDRAPSLLRWSGSAAELVVPQAPILLTWLEGYGPVLEVNSKDLGEPRAFNFVFVTSNGADVDLAPDSSVWRPYAMSALKLTAGRLGLAPARAGKPLVASMAVERSDFEFALEEGTIRCGARLGSRAFAGRGAFVAERVACLWRLPKNASGKRLAGSVAVTFQGVTARRAFSLRVR